MGISPPLATKEDVKEIFRRKNLGETECSTIADSLTDIPGIVKAMETPIIDVEQSKVVSAMERVILSLEKGISTGCKDSLLVQILTGKI